MADFVQVVVQVDKSQLTSLNAEIDRLNGKNIKINVDSKGAENAAGNIKKTATGLQDANKQASIFGDSLDRIVLKMAAWQIVGTTVATVIRSFREAVATMREVDQELTNIAKVSDLSAREIKKIGDEAYETASKYGVAADEYLSAVYTFQKAGLGESSTQMAELATKLMLVGDTTADIASQFLVSANAAWKLGGDMEKLSLIIDEADYINNNYATTLEDIAVGLPIVGATAAQAGMTIEETMAAIGTIVASTGQSASKAATALRAIIMNLIGEAGELDDGTVITAESIDSLNKVLNKYAPEAMAAAEAAGKMINPLEAIAALAQAAEDPLVTESELFSILADLGGKLRTTQLTALVNNLDMAGSMLEGMGAAAGTADKEIATMLESWNAKTQILKNTWTQFLTNFIDTGLVKGAIDALTLAIKFLDSGFGKFAITVGLAVGATALLSKAFTSLSKSALGMFVKDLLAANAGMVTVAATESGLAVTTTGLAGAFKALGTAMLSNPLFIAGAAVAAIYGIVKLVDKLTMSTGEYIEKLDDLKSQYDDAQSKIDEFTSKIEQNEETIAKLNDAEKDDTFRIRLQEENEYLREQIALEKERQKSAAKEALDTATEVFRKSYKIPMGFEPGNITALGAGGDLRYTEGDIFAKADALKPTANSSKAQRDAFQDELDLIVKSRDEIRKFAEAYGGLTAEQQKFLDTANEYIKNYLEEVEDKSQDMGDTIDGTTDDINKNTDAVNNNVTALEKLVSTLDDLAGKLDVAQKAFKEFDESGELSYSTLSEIATKFSELNDDSLAGYIEKLSDASLTSEELRSIMGEMTVALVEQKIAAGELTAADQVLIAKMLEEAGVANASEVATMLLRDALLNAKKGANELSGAISSFNGTPLNTSTKITAVNNLGTAFSNLIGNINNSMNALASFSDIAAATGLVEGMGFAKKAPVTVKWTPTTGDSGGSSGGGGGGGSSSSSRDEELQRLKSIVSLRESELDFLEASGKSEGERIKKIKQIQSALHDQAEYLRKTEAYIRGDADALAEVNALSTKWWKLQKDILDIQEDIKKALDDSVDSLSDALAGQLETARDRETDALEAQLQNLRDQRNAVQEVRKEEELLLAVEKARAALANAQNERTVRQYNSQTGQWEWVANAQNVQKAEETLLKAEQALAEFYEQQAFDAMEEAIERQIKNVESAYDKLKDAIEYAADMIRSGAWTFEEAFSYLLHTASSVGAEFSVSGLTDVIEDAINSTDVRAAIIARMKANSAAWHTADETERQRLADENLRLGTAQGWSRSSAGVWYDENGIRLYDSGGVLYGTGAIKATSNPEMVVPPAMTAALLNAEQNGSFDALMKHLGIVTAAANSYAGLGGGTMRDSIGEQHNGDVFYFNGIEMNNVTENTTMGEFISKVRGLAIYSRS